MQTGQNSIAPKNSLPQLGQVRWGSVVMVLTVVQPKATRRSTEWCETGQHGSLANCCPVSQAITSSFRIARQITFQNKIPAVDVLRCPELIKTFNNGVVRNQWCQPSTFELAIKPCGSSDGHRFTIEARSARAARRQERHLQTESQRGDRFKSGKTLASNSLYGSLLFGLFAP
jgi:hypothetical protein